MDTIIYKYSTSCHILHILLHIFAFIVEDIFSTMSAEALFGTICAGGSQRCSEQTVQAGRGPGSWSWLDPSAGLERGRCAHTAPGMAYRTQYQPNH